MGSGGRGKNAFKFIGPPGFEFLCEAQIQSIVERVTRMGGAGLRGPTLDPHKTTLLEDSGLFDRKELSAHCPECSQLRETGITGFVGDWWRTERDYDQTFRILSSAFPTRLWKNCSIKALCCLRICISVITSVVVWRNHSPRTI